MTDGSLETTLVLGGQPMVLRDLTPEDAGALLALHQRVFGGTVDAAWYCWKYGNSHCGGGGEGMGVWHEGQLIAHCGGVPRRMWHQGVSACDLQIGDVMVAPEWRGVLTRRGPFFHVCQGLYASRLGVKNRFQVGFGFPSARHFRLAVKVGLLWDGGSVTEVHWKNPAPVGPNGGLSRWHWQTSPLHPDTTGFDRAVDSAWEQMRSNLKTASVGERTSAYVRWRFAQRPGHDPLFLQLRRPWARQPVGIAVLARPTVAQPMAHWLDWIGPPELMPMACLLCRTAAAGLGATGLMAWASRAVLERLTDTGMSSQTEAALIGVPWTSDLKGQSVTALNWWFMGGDTDFL